MKPSFLTLKIHLLLHMIDNILSLHLFTLHLPQLINHLFLHSLSLMTFYLLFLHYQTPSTFLFLPDVLLELEPLLLIYKFMFAIVLTFTLTLFPIIFLIITCLLIMLPLFSLYNHIMNQPLMLRQASMNAGNKQCKLSCWLLKRLVPGTLWIFLPMPNLLVADGCLTSNIMLMGQLKGIKPD